MAILVDHETRLLVQGITGKAGSFHTHSCCDYGTNIVAGVTPGRGGETFLCQSEKREQKIPVFDTTREAVEKTECNATMIFVPAFAAADAILEAAEAGIPLIICITEGIPLHDMMRVQYQLTQYPGIRLIGPNCPGIITPGACKIGIMPGYIHQPGSIGIISRSGTLTYEAVWQLTSIGLGQSTCIGIGGDPIHGMTHQEALELFENDPNTNAVVMIGEIGGSEEEEAAAWAREHSSKPITAFIAGTTAPKGRRMGHAGAIIQGNSGTAQSKIEALQAAGIAIAPTPAAIGSTLAQQLS